MKLAITVGAGADIDELRELILLLRSRLHDELTVLEAPKSVDYPYQLPFVVVDGGPDRGRHFGQDAVHLLRQMAAL